MNVTNFNVWAKKKLMNSILGMSKTGQATCRAGQATCNWMADRAMYSAKMY